jgi:hypothetical protein
MKLVKKNPRPSLSSGPTVRWCARPGSRGRRPAPLTVLLLAQTLPAEDVGTFAEAVADDWSLLLPRLSPHASK